MNDAAMWTGGRDAGPTRARDGDDNGEHGVDSVKRVKGAEGDSVAIVSSHYNAREDQGHTRRELSPIVFLRKFNNWVKSVLIGLYARPDITALDLCCGKGGDLQKWSKSGVRYVVGVDVAAISIQQAQARYQSQRGRLQALFIACDCFSDRFLPMLAEEIPSNVQFSMVRSELLGAY